MQKIHGPEGMRVWQGFRSNAYLDNRSEFVDKLGELIIPATMQMKGPAGMLGYFSSLLPNSDLTLPDHIALEIYESEEISKQVNQTSSSGKAYHVLQKSFFDFVENDEGSKSKFSQPSAFQGSIDFSQAYYLFQNEINWLDNKTNIFCAKRLPHISADAMLEHIQQVIPDWLDKNINVNGSILICEKDYVLYWEHSKYWDSGLSATSLFPRLSSVLGKPIINGKPLLRSVPPLHTLDYKGLKMEESSSIDIRVISAKVAHTKPIFNATAMRNQAC